MPILNNIYPDFRIFYFKKLILTFSLSVFSIILLGTFSSFADNSLSNTYTISTDSSDYCLSVISSNIVNLSKCYNQSNQDFLPELGSITYNNKCLSVANDHAFIFSIKSCDNSSAQTFLLTGNSYLNTKYNKCLISFDNNLNLGSCESASAHFVAHKIDNNNSSIYSPFDCLNYINLNERLACNTLKEWNNWNSPSSNHTNLLNNYTDGNSYEEWCADFVSYIYKESSLPFIYGERNGWDEYNANYIQYEKLVYHSVRSGYIPKAGDIAFFNYPGGHVEIVAVGGSTPTFVYGDSGTTDSQTGNGDMAANTLTSDGNLGNVTYYLSLN